MMDQSRIEAQKGRAKAWFEALRDDICAAFEALEDEAPAAVYGSMPGRFVRTRWSRTGRIIRGFPDSRLSDHALPLNTGSPNP